MDIENFIETAMNNVLKNPIVEVLREINFSTVLKQSNFVKQDMNKTPFSYGVITIISNLTSFVQVNQQKMQE